MIELNRLSVLIDHTAFEVQPKSFILLESEVPVINAPFKLGLVDWRWKTKENNQLPSEWWLSLAGEIVDSDWKVRCKLEAVIDLDINSKISRWMQNPPFRLVRAHLDEGSRIFIDEHQIDLINTINRMLTQQSFISNITDNKKLDNFLRTLSKRYLGSDSLIDQLNLLYYQMEGYFEQDKGKITLSAAGDLDHFSQKDDVPPYGFLNIPTNDLVYFVNHTDWPVIEIKGYQMIVKSIEVNGDNILSMNIEERNNDWDIHLELKITLSENTIYPEVLDIKAEGLDLLKKALFKIFKGFLIRQIEKNTISVTEMYRVGKSDIEKKYPFLQIQPGYRPVLDNLTITKGKTEMLLYFEENEEI